MKQPNIKNSKGIIIKNKDYLTQRSSPQPNQKMESGKKNC